MALKTREPTGKAGFPNLIVEGMEKRGKTTEVLKFTADPRVGRCFVIEVGERRADEYAALGNFEIVEWGGGLNGLVQAIRDVMAVAPLDGRPNVFILDTGTGSWDLVKRRAEWIARNSAQARATLEKDENAEITVGHQAWNKAKDPYWWGWLNELRAWPGIALIVCRADEVSKFEGGRPVVVGGVPQMEYRVEIESGTRFIMDGQVRVLGPTKPLRVITAASLHFTVPDGGLDLPDENPLGHLIFDLYKCEQAVTLDRVGARRAVIAACVALGDDDSPTEEDPEAKRTPAKIRAGRVWRSIWPEVSPTAFDGAAMRQVLDAVAADGLATPAAVVPAGDPGPGGGEDPDPPVEDGTGEHSAPRVDDFDEGNGTPGADHPDPHGDDGAHDLDDATLDQHDGEPSTVHDDPEVEAEQFALAYVTERVTTKTKCVAELALRGIAAKVQGSELPDLQSRLVDIIRDERLGVRPPPSGLSDTAPPNGGPVAQQQALA